MVPDVKNIIFDLGGVILDIDYNKPVAAFKGLGAADFTALYSKQSQAAFFSKFERGDITPAAFRKKVREYLPEGVTDAAIDSAWNAMLGELPEQRIVLLKMLAQMGYRLFLLSNTNSIHIRAFSQYMDQTFEKDLLKQLFEKVYFSSQIGMRKPTKKIFEYVLSENGLAPEETLFIDDSAQHIEGARKTGMHTHWLQEPETINDYFRGLSETFPDTVQ